MKLIVATGGLDFSTKTARFNSQQQIECNIELGLCRSTQHGFVTRSRFCEATSGSCDDGFWQKQLSVRLQIYVSS